MHFHVRERIKQWRETKARMKEEAKVEEERETSTEDKFKVSQKSKLDNGGQQKRRISEYRMLKEMKERLRRTGMITDGVSATLEWEENKAVMQNLKERVEGAADRVKDEDGAQSEVEEKVRKGQTLHRLPSPITAHWLSKIAKRHS